MDPRPSGQVSTGEQRGQVKNGMEIPFFTPGPHGPQITSCEDMNRIVAPLRGLTKPKVVFGDSWDFRLCDSSLTLQIGVPQTPTGGSGGSPQMFRLKSVQGNYVTARLWDGSSDGPTDIYLAKEFWSRTPGSFTASIYGVTHTFTFSSGPDSNNVIRNDSDGTNAADEVLLPPYVVNEVVHAIQCTTDVVDGGGNPVTWIMIRTGMWAKPSPLAVIPTTPASASDTTAGYTGGLMVADSNYIYVSTGANTWKRVAIATW